MQTISLISALDKQKMNQPHRKHALPLLGRRAAFNFKTLSTIEEYHMTNGSGNILKPNSGITHPRPQLTDLRRSGGHQGHLFHLSFLSRHLMVHRRLEQQSRSPT